MSISIGDAEAGTGLAGEIVTQYKFYMNERFHSTFRFYPSRQNIWALADALANAIGPEIGTGGGGTGVTDGDKGDITVSGTGAVWTIDAQSVTFSKIQNIASQRIIGRSTAGSGSASELTISQTLDWISSTRGSLLMRDASAWSVLSPGTTGRVLTSNGVGANPSYKPSDAPRKAMFIGATRSMF
jgi:hypothetical protein